LSRRKCRAQPHGAMGAACGRPEPPSPAEAAIAPPASCGQGAAGHVYEVELESGWAPYEPSVNAMICEAEARGQSRVEYTARRQYYVVDLRIMQQINKRSGIQRRVRRVDIGVSGSNNPAAADTLGPLRPTEACAEGPRKRLHAPPPPAAFPELVHLAEPELGKLRSNPAAMDEFLLRLPPARALLEQRDAAREEGGRLRRAAAGRLSSRAQQADAEADAAVQEALDAPRALDAAALTGFKDQFLQHKFEKQRQLLIKRRMECRPVEWHALILTPAAARAGT